MDSLPIIASHNEDPSTLATRDCSSLVPVDANEEFGRAVTSYITETRNLKSPIDFILKYSHSLQGLAINP